MTALSPKLEFDLGLGMELGLGLVVLINVLLNLLVEELYSCFVLFILRV